MIKLGTNKRLHERLLLHLVKSPWPNFPVLYSVNTIHRSALNVDLSLETESLMWALSGGLFQGGCHHLHHQHHGHHYTLHLHNNLLHNNLLHNHDSEKGGEDKSRVGASENTLLGSSDLSTIIGPGTGKVVEENITIITTLIISITIITTLIISIAIITIMFILPDQ